MRRIGVGAALLIGTAVILSSVAVAHEGERRDGSDVGGPLDVQRVEIRHHDGRLFFQIDMHDRFFCRDLRNDSEWVWVDLDSRGDR